MQRPRAVLDRDIQHGSQIAQRLEAHEGLGLEPHAGARGGIEHPDRDMEAVAPLVPRHMAAQHVRAGTALLAFDQDVLSEEWMPWIRDLPPLRALYYYFGESPRAARISRRGTATA